MLVLPGAARAASRAATATQVTAVSPNHALIGDSVHVLGERLGNGTAITIDGVAATVTAVTSSQDVTVTVPTGTGASLDVAAAGPYGSHTKTGAFTYDASGGSQTLTAISYAQGDEAGGVPATIYGTGFTGLGGATIGGAAVTSFSVVSDTVITCVTPSGTVGAQDVVVGDATLTGGYTYIATEFAGEPTYDAGVDTLRLSDTFESYSIGKVRPSSGSSGQAEFPVTPACYAGATAGSVTVYHDIVDLGGDVGVCLKSHQLAGQSQPSAQNVNWTCPQDGSGWNAPSASDTVVYQYYLKWGPITPGDSVWGGKWFEMWHDNGKRIQSGMWYNGGTTDYLGNHVGYKWAWNDTDVEFAYQPVAPYPIDTADGAWHRFTHLYKANSSAGAGDGIARMWIDGSKILDASPAAAGVTPIHGTKVWCTSGEVNNISTHVVGQISFSWPGTCNLSIQAFDLYVAWAKIWTEA